MEDADIYSLSCSETLKSTNWKWRAFTFRVKGVSYFHDPLISKGAAFALKVNGLHFQLVTAW